MAVVGWPPTEMEGQKPLAALLAVGPERQAVRLVEPLVQRVPQAVPQVPQVRLVRGLPGQTPVPVQGPWLGH